MDLVSRLANQLHQTKNQLPETVVQTYQRLFLEEEHFIKLAQKLICFATEGVPESFPLPHFNVECTPPLKEAYRFFEKAMQQFFSETSSPEIINTLLAEALQQALGQNILILLGQRITPASLTDARGIPPTKAQLLASASQLYDQGLTVGARAWSKHAHRSTDQFWGEVKGSTEAKNQKAFQLISYILDHTTWWNIFGHYKHDIVYEARVPAGQGVRWGHSGKELIGFLEPFLNEEADG